MYRNTGICTCLALALITASASADDNQQKSIDGSTTITCGVSTLLFGGATPSKGFMIQTPFNELAVNDNGPASFNPPVQGFYVLGGVFITPPGYRPMGPVSVNCNGTGPAYVAARAW